MFRDEIHPDEIPNLYAQCHIGLVALDPRHRTHNIPGKFLTYMQSGLPVLASVNVGNDLVGLIEQERVGRAVTDASAESLARAAVELVEAVSADDGFAARLFSAETAVRQIVSALA